MSVPLPQIRQLIEFGTSKVPPAGFVGASRRANCSNPTLVQNLVYRHYGNKEDLRVVKLLHLPLFPHLPIRSPIQKLMPKKHLQIAKFVRVSIFKKKLEPALTSINSICLKVHPNELKNYIKCVLNCYLSRYLRLCEKFHDLFKYTHTSMCLQAFKCYQENKTEHKKNLAI